MEAFFAANGVMIWNSADSCVEIHEVKNVLFKRIVCVSSRSEVTLCSACPDKSLSKGAMWWTHLVGQTGLQTAAPALHKPSPVCVNERFSPLKLTDVDWRLPRSASDSTLLMTDLLLFLARLSEHAARFQRAEITLWSSGAWWRAEPAGWSPHECTVFWGTLPAYQAHRGFLPGFLQSSL